MFTWRWAVSMGRVDATPPPLNSGTCDHARSVGCLEDAHAATYEIGVDIGGTFTDVVCRVPGRGLQLMKIPSTRTDPGLAVVRSVAVMAERWGVDPAAVMRFSHGTTVATNAVLERKGARIGLICTEGFRDVIEIGRQFRRHVYRVLLEPETPVFLAPGRVRREVPERVAADGTIVVPLDRNAMALAVDELVAAGVEAIAIVFLFSFANPEHERAARDIVRERHPELAVSVSHEVDPAFREYERTVVTAFDAYVKPVINRYLAGLEGGLGRAGVVAPLQVMQSRGGLTASPVARKRPVRLFLSGPAAGVVGGRIVGASAGIGDLITIDIGGTSADIALISAGKPMLRAEGVIGDYAVRVAMVDVNTIGSGGGSIARVDAAGSLRVGPESAGSEPGPACYGRGGREATVTDASVLLGYVDPEDFAGGTFRLDPAAAAAVIDKRIAGPLGLGRLEAALGVHRVLNARMAEGIRLVSVRQGIDPRRYALVPLGGAGGTHATPLARELGMTRVLVPRIPGVLAAAGLLASPVEHDVSVTFVARLDGLDLAALHKTLAGLDAETSSLMAGEAVEPSSVTISYIADVCYVGQSYSIEVPFNPAEPSLADWLRERFMDAHDRLYGYSADSPAKIVALRAIHRSGGSETIPEMRFEPSGGPVVRGERAIFVEGRVDPVTATVYDREAMEEGFAFVGPAIVRQPDTTTLIEPGWSGQVDAAGNLLLNRD